MLIIFDLDDTIIDTSGSILPYKLEQALKSMVEHGLEVPRFSEAFRMLQCMDAVSDSTLHALKEFSEIHDAPIGALTVASQEVYGNKKFEYDVLTTPEAMVVLADLAKKHRLAVVTAGIKEVQMEKMKKAGVDTSIFSRIVVCDGYSKKVCYQQLMEDLQVPASEIIVCGDRVKRDLLPGKDLGFRTVHMRWGRGRYQRGERGEVDCTINSLSRLREIMVLFEEY